MTLLYPHWPSALLLCLFAVAFGSVFGTNPTISDALTLTVLGERRVSAYGSVRLWTSLGWAIAVMVAGAFYQFHGLALMVPFALFGLIGMVMTVRGFSGDRHGPVVGGEQSLRVIPRLLAQSRPLVLWLLALTLISVCTQAAIAFVPLAIADAGGGPLLLAVSASVGALFEIPLFAASDVFDWGAHSGGNHRLLDGRHISGCDRSYEDGNGVLLWPCLHGHSRYHLDVRPGSYACRWPRLDVRVIKPWPSDRCGSGGLDF